MLECPGEFDGMLQHRKMKPYAMGPWDFPPSFHCAHMTISCRHTCKTNQIAITTYTHVCIYIVPYHLIESHCNGCYKKC